jgi:hypothetical protein
MNTPELEVTPKKKPPRLPRGWLYFLPIITIFYGAGTIVRWTDQKSDFQDVLTPIIFLLWLTLTVVAFAIVARHKKQQIILQPAVLKWAKAKYNINLTEKQAKTLSQNSRVPVTDVEGYVSEPVVLWEKDTLGKSLPRTLRLLLADKTWILYCSELEAEYPLKGEKEEIHFFKTLWGEVSNHQGIFTLRDTETQTFVSQRVNNKDTVLFWSDPLRAELYATKPNYEVVFVPVNAFIDDILLQLESDRSEIGLNWGEEQKSYDAGYIHSLMT